MAETDQDQAQKTEQATEKRLHEAHERGQFAKSPEFSVLCTLAAAVGMLAFTLQSSARALAEYSVGMFTGFVGIRIEIDTVAEQLLRAMLALGNALLPVLIATAGAAVLAGSIQSGFRVSSKAIGFKLENLNPTNGFKRLFSKATLVRGGLDILKLVAIGGFLVAGARALFEDPLFSAPVEAAYLGQFLQGAAMTFLTRVLCALAVVAAIGYAWEKYKTSRDLMMTRQELKDERKNSEGDATVKSAMRRLARRIMQKQMLAAVPTADVIITNPTHYAVALKYERGLDQAPIVLAKGENRFAQRIKALAAEHGVPTVENKPVARVLFALGKVGEGIPPELYQAVAEILAVVYRTHRFYFHQLRTRRWEAAA
ncbi:MAG TPA: EscU/YscU/HrcU family type III secretion system export apparatus switch protein [Opitutaceae bacterium]|nr:EscU/YscU/HrcU family type III secretion system export apparatus switch protein [Opitutaceae bacterium]